MLTRQSPGQGQADAAIARLAYIFAIVMLRLRS
jgi:hypothetical protein